MHYCIWYWVNCQNVHESIHFGPSSSITNYVQESGRIGRDNLPSTSRLFYNSVLLSKSDTKIREFFESMSCRRSVIISSFSVTTDVLPPSKCLCCDVCAKTCKCSDSCLDWCEVGISTLNPIPGKQIRQVRSDDKNLLEELLLQYRSSLLHYEEGVSIKSVGIPNIYVEFDLFLS